MEPCKIKILIYGMSDNIGGIETYLYNLAKNCDYSKFSLDFVEMSEKEIVYKDEIEKFGAKVIKLNLKNGNWIQHYKKLKELLNSSKYDYVYMNVMACSLLQPFILAAKNKETKLCIHSHTSALSSKYSLKTKFVHYFSKNFVKNNQILKVACGKKAGRYIFGNKNFTVFYNGIEVPKFQYSETYRNEIRKEFDIKSHEKLYGNIARLAKAKNPIFLVEVFDEILKRDKDAKFILVGNGDMEIQVKEKIKNLGLEERVVLTGRRDDANKFYSALDVVVLPSLYEGFPVSLVEAQVNGLKCYASDVIDNEVNMTKNIKFISLKKNSEEWAEIIMEDTNRDFDVLTKIPSEFYKENCYKEVFLYFEEKIKNNIFKS